MAVKISPILKSRVKALTKFILSSKVMAGCFVYVRRSRNGKNITFFAFIFLCCFFSEV